MSASRPPVVAIRPDERPPIVCPDWCIDSYEHHFEELGEWEGFVIHHSGPRQWVWHSRSAYPDNTVDPDEPPQIWVDTPLSLTVEQAEVLARNVSAAIEEAKR